MIWKRRCNSPNKQASTRWISPNKLDLGSRSAHLSTSVRCPSGRHRTALMRGERPRYCTSSQCNEIAPPHWLKPKTKDRHGTGRSRSIGRGHRCPLWVKSGHRIRSASCPLYPQKRTWIGTVLMSALCQKRTSAVSLNHLVGTTNQCWR
jgi:hypothetical protein